MLNVIYTETEIIAVLEEGGSIGVPDGTAVAQVADWEEFARTFAQFGNLEEHRRRDQEQSAMSELAAELAAAPDFDALKVALGKMATKMAPPAAVKMPKKSPPKGDPKDDQKGNPKDEKGEDRPNSRPQVRR